MVSPVWNLHFVPHGKRVAPPLPDGTIAFDVGNGSPEDRIFDHHQEDAAADSTAELLLHHRAPLHAHLNDQDSITLITHEQPDFDALTAFFLGWTLASSDDASVPSSFAELAAFASSVDQGRVRPDESLTLYTFVLMLGAWLTSEDGVDFRNSDSMRRLLQEAQIQPNGSPSTDTCTAALTLHLLRDWRQTPQWSPPDPIDQAWVSPPVSDLLSSLSTRLQAQVRACRRDRARARRAGDIGSMTVPTRNGSRRDVPFVRVVDPDANPSVLGKHLRTWSRQEHDAPVVTLLQFREARRSIASVPPESTLTLKGLGLYLETLEQQERDRRGIQDEDAPRYQAVDDEGQVQVDPLFSSSDPWYDGRGHNFTIVDAPRNGSLLSLEQVYDAVVNADWLSCADRYQSRDYQQWKALGT